jgi:acyl-CoA thioesterase I
MTTKIKNGDTVLFIGDSITDCNWRGAEAPFGNGYVRLFLELMCIREPEKRFTLINKGLGGDKVTNLASGLQGRWTDEVIRNKPDWLGVLIGINDIHSYLLNTPEIITPEVYERAYNEVLARTRRQLPKCRVFLAEPFYISQDKDPNSFRSRVHAILPTYIRIVHKLSRKYKTGLVPLHNRFQQRLRCQEPNVFGVEPVHPNHTGHLLIAEEFYRAMS